jgi:hypothetical protein
MLYQIKSMLGLSVVILIILEKRLYFMLLKVVSVRERLNKYMTQVFQ